MRNELFSFTQTFLTQSPSEHVYYTWKWIRTGEDHVTVNPTFKNLWNSCNVYDWIEFRATFEHDFIELSKEYERVYSAFRENIMKQLTDVLDAASADLRISGILLDTIRMIKNV